MRILSVVGRTYYGQPHAIEPMYLQFTLPLQGLGHQVDHFDHLETTRKIGPAECGEQFVGTVRGGGYDLVLYQTGGQDHMAREAIPQAAKYADHCVEQRRRLAMGIVLAAYRASFHFRGNHLSADL